MILIFVQITFYQVINDIAHIRVQSWSDFAQSNLRKIDQYLSEMNYYYYIKGIGSNLNSYML